METSAYAQVIIDISRDKLDHPFLYRIPQSLADQVHLGSLVTVPFGRGNTVREGYVIGFPEQPDYPDEKIKEILAVPARGSDETGAQMVRLAAWMKEMYGSTMITALKTVLTSRKEARPVEEREVHLTLSEADAGEKLAYYEQKHQVARARLLRELMEIPVQPYRLILDKLHVTAQTMRAMQEQGVLKIVTVSTLRNPVSLGDVGQDTIRLSAAQQSVVDGVVRDFDALQQRNPECRPTQRIPRVSLIHGITGSGKTEVYIRIIEEIVHRGRQAIMLIPEIALTYQTLIRFYRHFGDRVSVMNSTLTPGEKSDQFERARRGEIDVIIGPRSALFTPFPKVGVIVIDEEHESSYKNESMPKYHAREVAIQIAKMQGAVVVLGSATPSLDSYYHAQQGDYRLYELKERLTGGTLPEVSVADMRQELQQGNRSILSRRLQALLEDRLQKGEQTMLFLNRRGFSGFVSCRSCGYVIKCPHCDVALSLHRGGKLICHYCGYEQPMPKVCPECGSKYISGFRAGTEQVESYLQKCYPKARILRMDADTTAKKGAYEKILSSFANEEADILIGTQMIVKGHDFPKVTLVGILLADMSLYSNDYRAGERTFQLLTQAAGRAGRGVRPGSVVIQTYQPENYAIQHASRQDYSGFYEEEIRYRSQLMYPPVYHMVAVQVQSKNDDYAQMMAGRIRELVDRITKGINAHAGKVPEVLTIGPAPASIARIRDEYRYVVYMKCAKYDTLIECKDRIEAYAAAVGENLRGDTIQVQLDFDPVNPY